MHREQTARWSDPWVAMPALRSRFRTTMGLPVVAALLAVAGAACDVVDRPVRLADKPDTDDDPCMYGEERPCAQDDALVQYCLEDATWGICLDPDEVECTPGEEQETTCGFELPGWGLDRCELTADGVPTWKVIQPCEEGTPLALVPAGTTPRFLPADDRFFAISASGCNTDWPTADTPWLARDLDGNGRIDGGHELFGSLSDIGGRTARHGFEALATLDANGDGIVDARDPAFSELVLWADADGDRRTLPGELRSLPEAGIDAIPLSFRRERTCDGRGNCGVERVDLPGGAQIVDLYLACR